MPQIVRRALPLFQSLFWASVISGVIFGQVSVGWAHDALGSYADALVVVTVGASFACFVLCQYLGWARPFVPPSPMQGQQHPHQLM